MPDMYQLNQIPTKAQIKKYLRRIIFGMKINLQKFWLILWCWTTQVPVRQTAALTKISRKGAYHWFEIFRSHLPENPVILRQIVQLDEAFFKKRTLMLAK